MLAYQLTRAEVVHKFTCADYAYFQAADLSGLWPDPIMETAKLRATIVRMMSTSRTLVNLADYLPEAMVPPDVPDPEADARAMAAFTAGFKAMKGK